MNMNAAPEAEVHGEEYYGRRITAAKFAMDALRLTFDDGVTIVIADTGQSCCEHRYAVCDDDVSKLIGGVLVAILEKPGPDIEEKDSWDEHQQGFVDVKTTDATITMTTHNKHNGYYGGFSVCVHEAAER